MQMLAQTLVWHEALIAAAALLMLWGTRLCWVAPRARMSIEEHAKDGLLSADAARRKIKTVAWRGPLVTILGAVLLAVALLR